MFSLQWTLCFSVKKVGLLDLRCRLPGIHVKNGAGGLHSVTGIFGHCEGFQLRSVAFFCEMRQENEGCFLDRGFQITQAGQAEFSSFLEGSGA